MPELVIDAIVLAPPEDAADVDAVDAYVARLLAVRDLAVADCFRVVATADAHTVLATTGRYPTWPAVQATGTVAAKDVARVIATLLSDAPLEDDLGIATLDLDDERCTPDTHLAGRAAEFVTHHHYVLCLHTLRQAQRATHASAVLTAGPAIRTVSPATVVAAEGTALIAYRDEGAAAELQFYAGAAMLVTEVGGAAHRAGRVTASIIPRGIAPAQLWRDGCFVLAIEAALVERSLGTAGSSAAAAWAFGRVFVAAVEAGGFAHEPAKIGKLLEACVDTILGERMPRTHEIRTNKNKGSPPRVRQWDEARAMRRDVDTDCHLHYWQRPGAGPEFAYVTTNHHDMTIPE